MVTLAKAKRWIGSGAIAKGDYFLRAFCSPVHYHRRKPHFRRRSGTLLPWTVKGEAELGIIEEHLLICSDCIDAAEETARYEEAMRAPKIPLNVDL